MNSVLWVVQGLLALAFLLAGAMKAFPKLSTVKQQFPWANDLPAALVRFIGAAEVLGAIGLIVPAVTGILPWLTVAAASGLLVVMLLAISFHASRREFASSGITVVLLLLAAFVVLGRWVLFPL
jgi:putative oxidoreductase